MPAIAPVLSEADFGLGESIAGDPVGVVEDVDDEDEVDSVDAVPAGVEDADDEVEEVTLATYVE